MQYLLKEYSTIVIHKQAKVINTGKQYKQIPGQELRQTG